MLSRLEIVSENPFEGLRESILQLFTGCTDELVELLTSQFAFAGARLRQLIYKGEKDQTRAYLSQCREIVDPLMAEIDSYDCQPGFYLGGLYALGEIADGIIRSQVPAEAAKALNSKHVRDAAETILRRGTINQAALLSELQKQHPKLQQPHLSRYIGVLTDLGLLRREKGTRSVWLSPTTLLEHALATFGISREPPTETLAADLFEFEVAASNSPPLVEDGLLKSSSPEPAVSALIAATGLEADLVKLVVQAGEHSALDRSIRLSRAREKAAECQSRFTESPHELYCSQEELRPDPMMSENTFVVTPGALRLICCVPELTVMDIWSFDRTVSPPRLLINAMALEVALDHVPATKWVKYVSESLFVLTS